MTRTHPKRLITSLLAAGILAAALVPAASAAPPRWNIAVTQLNPGAISEGSSQGFDIRIDNFGPSNISQLFLVSSVTDDTTYISSSRAGCSDVGDPLFCNFGALNARDFITVRVGYAMPAGQSAFNVTFEINSSGLVPGPGNNSHGDADTDDESVQILPANGNKASAWTFTNGSNVGNGPSLGSGNNQSTKVTGIGAFIPVDIADGSDVSFNCPKSKCKGKFLGEWSDVNVNNGAFIATAFGIEITIAKSILPADLVKEDVVLHHVLVNGTVETISAACVIGAAVPDKGCLAKVDFDNAGNLVIIALVHYNGGYKGAY